MKNYKNYIIEKKINKIDLDNIYNKYYQDVERKIFNQIVSADPTSTIDGNLYMGKYSKWLVDLYRNNKLKLEDLYKATEYLEIFDKQSVRNKISRKNINDYKDLPDLAKTIIKFKDVDEIKSKKELKEETLVKEFENYYLHIPRNHKESCILGKGTEWCTATEKTDEYFKEYHKPGRELLIFINKKNPKEKFQFHFRSREFMDIFDEDINIHAFLENYPDIDDWLKDNVKDYNRIHGKDIIWQRSSLEGSPRIINGDFLVVSHQRVTTLKGGPEVIKGNFVCSYNNLMILIGGPKKVD